MNEHAPSDFEWAQIEPLLPPRVPTNLVPEPIPWRAIFDAALYVEATGTSWRALPFTDHETARFIGQSWRRARLGDALGPLRAALPGLDLAPHRRELLRRAMGASSLLPDGASPAETLVSPGTSPAPDGYRAGNIPVASPAPAVSPAWHRASPGLSPAPPSSPVFFGLRGMLDSLLQRALPFVSPGRGQAGSGAGAASPPALPDPLPPWPRDRAYEAPTDPVGPVRMVEISAVSIRDLADATATRFAEKLTEIGGAGGKGGGGAGRSKGKGQILGIVWPDLGEDKQNYAHPITVLAAGVVFSGYCTVMLLMTETVAGHFDISNGAADILLIPGPLFLIWLAAVSIRRRRRREREAERDADREADRRRGTRPVEHERRHDGVAAQGDAHRADKIDKADKDQPANDRPAERARPAGKRAGKRDD